MVPLIVPWQQKIKERQISWDKWQACLLKVGKYQKYSGQKDKSNNFVSPLVVCSAGKVRGTQNGCNNVQ